MAIGVVALGLAGCQADAWVETSEGLTFLRVSGQMVAPAALFDVVVYIGEGQCLYVSQGGIQPKVLALADKTSVHTAGLITESGAVHPYGKPIHVQIPGPAEGTWDTPDLPMCTEANHQFTAIAFFED